VLEDPMRDARILIVDDEPVNVLVLRRLLAGAGYRRVEATTDAGQVLALFLELDPDLILLDLHMPHLDGFQVMEALRPWVPADAYLPILVLTADVTHEARARALAGGAKDFLTKPFDATEALLRVGNLLETRSLHLKLRHHNELLEERVRERTREVEESRLEMLQRLGSAIECRDDVTHEHTIRVATNSEVLALELGLPAEEARLIAQAAPLHDVGKIGVPDAILLKPGRLTADEFDAMKAHTVFGARILAGSSSPILKLAESIALTHHERWDGTGYAGVRGEAIPLASRIVSLADVFDALTHQRPYKPAWPADEAIVEIVRQAGRQFDPRVVAAFERSLARGRFHLPSSTGLGGGHRPTDAPAPHTNACEVA
jgi:putative two-component system response regulator